jgi:hypothetical protein
MEATRQQEEQLSPVIVEGRTFGSYDVTMAARQAEDELRKAIEQYARETQLSKREVAAVIAQSFGLHVAWRPMPTRQYS